MFSENNCGSCHDIEAKLADTGAKTSSFAQMANKGSVTEGDEMFSVTEAQVILNISSNISGSGRHVIHNHMYWHSVEQKEKYMYSRTCIYIV